jgi:hypothetical protein
LVLVLNACDLFVTGVNDTADQFLAGVSDTGEQLAPGVIDNGEEPNVINICFQEEKKIKNLLLGSARNPLIFIAVFSLLVSCPT